MFNALASVPNSDFAAHIQDDRRTWELGAEKSPDEVIAKAVTIYNNAVSAGRWEEKDSKDAKILALTTRMNEVVEQQEKWMALATTQALNQKSRNQNTFQPKVKIRAITEWRMKKSNESLEREGKTWY